MFTNILLQKQGGMKMNKSEFLDLLESRLKGLPNSEINKSVTYYSEAIDDRIEDGETEDEAVASLGEIDDIIQNAMSQASLSGVVKETVKRRFKVSVPVMILLILGSPIWLSLLIALFAVIFSLYVAAASVIIALFAVVISFILGGVTAVIGSPFVMFENINSAVFFIGAGLILIGVGIFASYASVEVTKLLIKFTKFVMLKTKALFVRACQF